MSTYAIPPHLQSRAWREWYEEYLRTPQWAEKKLKIYERTDGVCEGCRIERVEHVHHLTYDHAGDELLFELVGLCEPCHRKAHRKRGR